MASKLSAKAHCLALVKWKCTLKKIGIFLIFFFMVLLNGQVYKTAIRNEQGVMENFAVKTLKESGNESGYLELFKEYEQWKNLQDQLEAIFGEEQVRLAKVFSLC